MAKLPALQGIWRGRTVACIASGPSLEAEDCAQVRAAGLPVIVVNTSFRMAPWADVLYAMDTKWWDAYAAEVAAAFTGLRLCHARNAIRHGAACVGHEPWFHAGGNSGAGAISIAQHAGAGRIVLLGYDCQVQPGRAHWHDDHPPGLGNARTVDRWPAKFQRVAERVRNAGAHVVNCSRQTALTCFERGDLAQLLHS